jgi:hypothetical protein
LEYTKKLHAMKEKKLPLCKNKRNGSNGMYILKKVKADGQLEAAKFQVMH